MTNLWLIPALPLIGFLILFVTQGRLPKMIVSVVAVGSVAGAAVLTLLAGMDFAANGQQPQTEVLWTWMSVGSFTPSITMYFDGLARDDGCDHRGRRADPSLRDRLHVGRPRRAGRLQPLLLVHESVRLRDAHARARRQPAGAVPRLGRGGPLQLPPDRLLPSRSREWLRGSQGIRRHAGRRYLHGDRPLPALLRTRLDRDPGGVAAAQAEWGDGTR